MTGRSARVREVDLTSRAGLDHFVRFTLNAVRGRFETRGVIKPFAVILATKSPESGASIPLGVPMILDSEGFMPFDEPHKEAFSETIRAISGHVDAAGTVFVSECWMVVDGEVPEELFEKSLEHVPGRIEVILVMVEHKTLPKPQLWRAHITRENVVISLGEFELMPEMGTLTGRFLDMGPNSARA